jgi:hypothetical protein
MAYDPKLYMTFDNAVEAVQLRASEPGDPLSFDHRPQWFLDFIAEGAVRSVPGDKVDGTDWTYLFIETGEGEALVRTDDYIVRHTNQITGKAVFGAISRKLFAQMFEPIT